MITANQIAYALLAVVLLIAAITDCRSGKVYNWLTFPAILFGLGFWAAHGLLSGQAPGFAQAFTAFLVAAIPFGLIVILGGLGWGDVKLMAAVGAISASWQCVLSTAFYALLLAMLLAIGTMIYKGVARRTLQRLLSALLLYAGRQKVVVNTQDSPRIPFGLAVSVAGLIAGAEVLLHWQHRWSWISH